MENLVELMLNLMGAPAAFITPIVGAVLIGGWVQSLYKDAKESVERSGGSLWNEGSFLLSLPLAIAALSFVWTAFQVLFAIT
jgi:hypothetical protein